MINHIDLSSVLRRTVCDLYSNLVTRSTGAAVRSAIEDQLAALPEPTLTVIDFSNVGLLDFSCADEVVAKLLLGLVTEWPHRRAYVLFRGLRDGHLDAIESALETYGLALVAERAGDGQPELVGQVDDGERRLWELLRRRGPTSPAELATDLGDEATAADALEALHARRLVMRFEDTYVPLGARP